ncbi:MAG: selenocysteine-specific translation elongation factor [Candidatus Alcyoniella australis]|nr:selenocysteine-specific translation elongation factor [Candidatus Alcyoniella australis]
MNVPEKRLVLGTAGHVDHGKTSMVLRLSGIDTDRLKEEKTRGITIELGFAFIDLPSGIRLGIVDVPGHERFVRAMVAGAGGIDLLALIVAADEGVMPQTREHFEICRLLGVRHGLIVLTKIDLVEDPELLEMARQDVAELVADTFLADAPLVEFSATTGQGRDELIAVLDALAQQVEQRPTDGLFRMPIDRVFTLRGLGTVVTGTSIEGEIQVGAEVEVLPSRKRAKVRSIQVHGESADAARAGQRTAINLQGVDRDEIERGEVLVPRKVFTPTHMFDARVSLLSEAAALKPRTRVRVHAGTAEILGRIVNLESERIEPGSTVLAQIRLEQPLVLMPEDRFVLRSYSPVRTIGGGMVLHARPGKHKPGRQGLLADLRKLADGTLLEQVAIHVEGAGFRGLAQRELPTLVRASRREINRAFDKLLAQGTIVKVEREESRAIHSRFLQMVTSSIAALLERYHADRPNDPGMPLGELRSRIEYPLPGRLFNRALEALAASSEVVVEQDIARRADHKVVLAGKLQQTVEEVADIFARAGLTPPTQNEVLEQFDDREYALEALKQLSAQGKIVRVAQFLYFDAAALEKLAGQLKAYLEQHGEINAQGYKELTGASRKFTIPLAEYFDRIKLTVRRGDVRLPRRSG